MFLPAGPCQLLNIEALCAAPPEALAHSPNHMPLSCPVAPLSQRELRKDGGGGGDGVARRARAAPGPEGQVLRHVLWHSLRHVLRSILRRVLHVPVLHMLVLHVSPKGGVGSGTLLLVVGFAAGRWRWAR